MNTIVSGFVHGCTKPCEVAASVSSTGMTAIGVVSHPIDTRYRLANGSANCVLLLQLVRVDLLATDVCRVDFEQSAELVMSVP